MVLPPNVQAKAVASPSKRKKKTTQNDMFQHWEANPLNGSTPQAFVKREYLFSHRCGILKSCPQAKQSLGQEPRGLQQLSPGGQLGLAMEFIRSFNVRTSLAGSGRMCQWSVSFQRVSAHVNMAVICTIVGSSWRLQIQKHDKKGKCASLPISRWSGSLRTPQQLMRETAEQLMARSVLG